MLWGKKSAGPKFGHVSFDDDRDIDVQRVDDEARKHFWSEARLLLRDLVFALLVAALFVVFVMQPVKVEGTSMLPRLHDGERIFVNKLVYYHLPKLERGDIVVFWYPDDPDKSYIKRVIGLPGELMEIRDGVIYVNGQELKEPYIEPERNVTRLNHAPVLIKSHYYFVAGDNRDQSYDSRSWGLVPEKYIYGKALLRYWPLAQASVIRHETDYRLAPRPGAQPTPAPGDDDEVEP
ncbi:MAG: signal peptidase I [Acidobacteria bacterium]|nr:signal peptidase I [Acidobacteriota bacterium]MCA1641415.1 signal peptidase I [Acidobacteriota bacterium]